ncbi:hypothetical protein OPW39_15805 [Vibrio europaeus]|uniref:hypothetical protein n=1 Tax=Vibrio europaeus TaxID=300876 RepID=UPI00233F2A5B|nr:hypothetical protein [Vibrio europaeus]MDC5870273.1 hypothetical protein [Vibrio europaeus]
MSNKKPSSGQKLLLASIFVTILCLSAYLLLPDSNKGGHQSNITGNVQEEIIYKTDVVELEEPAKGIVLNETTRMIISASENIALSNVQIREKKASQELTQLQITIKDSVEVTPEFIDSDALEVFDAIPNFETTSQQVHDDLNDFYDDLNTPKNTASDLVVKGVLKKKNGEASAMVSINGGDFSVLKLGQTLHGYKLVHVGADRIRFVHNFKEVEVLVSL